MVWLGAAALLFFGACTGEEGRAPSSHKPASGPVVKVLESGATMIELRGALQQGHVARFDANGQLEIECQHIKPVERRR